MSIVTLRNRTLRSTILWSAGKAVISATAFFIASVLLGATQIQSVHGALGAMIGMFIANIITDVVLPTWRARKNKH